MTFEEPTALVHETQENIRAMGTAGREESERVRAQIRELTEALHTATKLALQDRDNIRNTTLVLEDHERMRALEAVAIEDRERLRTLETLAREDGEHIRALVRIAEIHERRPSRLEGEE
jgi:hypothetical protein